MKSIIMIKTGTLKICSEQKIRKQKNMERICLGQRILSVTTRLKIGTCQSQSKITLTDKTNLRIPLQLQITFMFTFFLISFYSICLCSCFSFLKN